MSPLRDNQVRAVWGGVVSVDGRGTELRRKGHVARFRWGSVLLDALAPREAIVCAPGLLDDRYGEQEYVVDRRRLKAITVIERF